MKILHVIDRLGLQYGGSAEVCRKQTKYLDAGHDVTIYTSDKGINGYLPDAVGQRYFDTPVTLMNVYAITPNMIKQDFKNYDIIHVHNYITFQNLITAYKHGDTPIVWQPHGGLVIHTSGYKIRQFSPFSLSRAIYSRILPRQVSHVIAVSNQEKEQAARLFDPDKITVIPNGIDLDDYTDLPERGSFRSVFGIPKDEYMVLYVGRCDWTKGIDTICDMFLEYGYFHMDKIHIVLIGVNNEFKSVANFMTMPPHYGRNKIAAYVDADIVILPSRYEIFGLTPLEAAACGTKVLVSSRAGISPLIESNPVLGRVCEPTAEALNRNILEMLKEKDTDLDRDRRRDIASAYDWGFIIKKIEKIYKEVLMYE